MAGFERPLTGVTFGAKEVGEGSTVPVPGAVAHATAVWIKDLPITPQEILAALRARQEAETSVPVELPVRWAARPTYGARDPRMARETRVWRQEPAYGAAHSYLCRGAAFRDLRSSSARAMPAR